MIAIGVGTGGHEVRGAQRGREYDTVSGLVLGVSFHERSCPRRRRIVEAKDRGSRARDTDFG